MEKNNFKVIIFDFDGVIIDSNQIKYDSFFDIFSNDTEKQVVKQVLSKIRESSRYEILKQIFIQLDKPKNQLEDLVNEYAEKYNKQTLENLTQDRVFSGATNILSELQKNYRLYIVSTTPQITVRKITKKIGLDKYFIDVFGVPTIKADNHKNIIDKENVKGSEVLVVGDGESDLQAAQMHNSNFIGIANDFNGWRDINFSIINNIKDLISMIDIVDKGRK